MSHHSSLARRRAIRIPEPYRVSHPCGLAQQYGVLVQGLLRRLGGRVSGALGIQHPSTTLEPEQQASQPRRIRDVQRNEKASAWPG